MAEQTETAGAVIVAEPLKRALEQFSQLKAQADAKAAALDALEVRTENERIACYDAGREVTKILTAVEAKRKEAKEPFLGAGKSIDEYAKALGAPLEAAKTRALDKVAKFDTAENARKAAATKKIEEEQARLRAEGEEQARKLRETTDAEAKRIKGEDFDRRRREILETIPPGRDRSMALRRLEAEQEGKLAELEAQLNAETTRVQIDASVSAATLVTQKEELGGKAKGSGARWTWDRETINLSEVPREYLQLDEAKVTAAVKAGAREIAGIRIFEEKTLAFR